MDNYWKNFQHIPHMCIVQGSASNNSCINTQYPNEYRGISEDIYNKLSMDMMKYYQDKK